MQTTTAKTAWRWAAMAIWISLSPPVHAVADSPFEREHDIAEPVFDGRARVYEAGIGHDETIVLVHGIGDEAAGSWKEAVPWLARRFHVVAFDLPGFGRSSKANVLYSPANYVAFIKHVVDRHAQRPFALMGHSMGGAVSLRYAATFPADVTRLVLVDAAGILHRLAYANFLSYLGIDALPVLYGGQRDDLGGLATGVLRKMENIMFEPETIVASAAARESVLDAKPAKIAGLALVVDDFSRIVSRVKAPTLIVWGSDDQIAPVRTGQVLDALIPVAGLTTIKAAHVPMTENPPAFREAVEDFLAGGKRLEPKPARVRARLTANAREAACVGKRNLVFEGEFKSLSISHCEGVHIRNARIGGLSINHSSVTIENSDIGEGAQHLRARSSRVTMTGGSIEADTAIVALGAHLDLAGVSLVGREHAVHAPQKSSLVFSLCNVRSPHTRGPVHGHRNVTSGKPL